MSEKAPLIMTLTEIEAVLGKSLPRSAWKSRGFWSNRTSGGLQAMAWLEAGYQVEDVDFQKETVTFGKPSIQYEVRRDGETILWTGSMIHALRVHLGISQAELSEMLGVRQQTISEWENSIYMPTRSRSKHLHMVAEKAGFELRETKQTHEDRNST
jgi:DNA-binding transcriptional regulator YiaG